MKKSGFTLIELLAVIVILAIIALIAVPIVLNIIEDSKNSSQKESIKLYLDTVDKYIVKENMKKKYNPDYCNIVGTGDLNCYSNGENLGTLVIEMNGKKPEDGTLYFSNGVITTGENIKLEGKFYQLEANGSIKEGYNDIIATYINRVKGSVGNITGTCTIGTNKVTCNGTETSLGNGTNATSGTIVFSNGEVTSYKNVLINETYYHESNGNRTTSETEKYATLVNDIGTFGLSLGDEYAYQVNDTDTFTFYVLSIEGTGTNQKVNLIMDRNICNDGSITYTSTNNYCRYKWYSSANNNTYGPTTVMAELYAGTKEWVNVPAIELNYPDEANGTETDKGYTSLVVSNGVGTMTGKPTTNTATVGTSSQPLKARLPKYSEVNGAGCRGSNGSCPVWLMGYMTYYNASNDKYSMNNNSEAYQNQIYGYWLLSSYPGNSVSARIVDYYGRVDGDSTPYGNYGARPVIIVSTSDLS